VGGCTGCINSDWPASGPDCGQLVWGSLLLCHHIGWPEPGGAAKAARQQGKENCTQTGYGLRLFQRRWCQSCLSRRAFRVALISVVLPFQPASNGLWW